MDTKRSSFAAIAARCAVVLVAATLSGCGKSSSLPSRLVIDFALTERLMQSQPSAVNQCQSVEIYSQGEQAERESFYLSVEDLRSSVRKISGIASKATVQMLLDAIREGAVQLSSETRHPSTRQQGTTFHVLFVFDGDSRFAYFQLFVPSADKTRSILIPRSDSPPLVGNQFHALLLKTIEAGGN
jgi:hypothetical protein